MPRRAALGLRQIGEAAKYLHALYTSSHRWRQRRHRRERRHAVESDYKQLLGVVADEANVNLGTIEEAVESFVKNPARAALLEDVPGLLSQIQGAADIEPGTSGGLVEVTQQHVHDIRDGRLPAEAVVLDGLALEIGTIGAYLDGLKHGRRNLEVLIDAALREMNTAIEGKRRTVAAPRPATAADGETASLVRALRAAIETWASGANDSATRATAQQRLDALARAANQPEQGAPASYLRADGQFTATGAGRVGTSADVATTLKQSLDTLAELAGVRVATAPSHRRRPRARRPEGGAAAEEIRPGNHADLRRGRTRCVAERDARIRTLARGPRQPRGADRDASRLSPRSRAVAAWSAPPTSPARLGRGTHSEPPA